MLHGVMLEEMHTRGGHRRRDSRLARRPRWVIWVPRQERDLEPQRKSVYEFGVDAACSSTLAQVRGVRLRANEVALATCTWPTATPDGSAGPRSVPVSLRCTSHLQRASARAAPDPRQILLVCTRIEPVPETARRSRGPAGRGSARTRPHRSVDRGRTGTRIGRTTHNRT